MFAALLRFLMGRKRAWVETFVGADAAWRVRVVGRNGEKMLLSESFASHGNAERAADGLVGIKLERRPTTRGVVMPLALVALFALVVGFLLFAPGCAASRQERSVAVKARTLAPQPRVDLSRDQMRQRALELVDLGLLSRHDVPDRSKAPQIISSALGTGGVAYPFAMFMITPPGSSHPGIHPVPIDGGNLIRRFVVRQEFLQVGSWTEPYYVIYAEHGPGVFTVTSGDTNDTAYEGLAPR